MKIINLLLLIIFIFQNTPTFSMEEEEEINLVKIKPYGAKQGAANPSITKPSNKEDTVRFDDNSCTHWGLKRWADGIKEYVIDRCMGRALDDFNPMDEDRTYRNDEYNLTTNCCCIWFNACCTDCLFNNPIGGTLCFPLAATCHLLLLPTACCYPSKDGKWSGKIHTEKKVEWYGSGSKEKSFVTSNQGDTGGYVAKQGAIHEPKKYVDEEYSKEQERVNLDYASSYGVIDNKDYGFDSRNCPYYEGGLETKYEYSSWGARMYLQPYRAQYCYHCGQIHKKK